MWEALAIPSPPVTSNEELSALEDLRKLLEADLTTVELDHLYDGIRSSELAFDSAQKWTGQIVVELRRRGIPWSQIENATDVSKGTLDRRANRVQPNNKI